MSAKEAKSSTVLVVKNLVDAELITVHAQRMVLYPPKRHNMYLSREVRQQAIHYDAGCH